jgi:hypothetical protein
MGDVFSIFEYRKRSTDFLDKAKIFSSQKKCASYFLNTQSLDPDLESAAGEFPYFGISDF